MKNGSSVDQTLILAWWTKWSSAIRRSKSWWASRELYKMGRQHCNFEKPILNKVCWILRREKEKKKCSKDCAFHHWQKRQVNNFHKEAPISPKNFLLHCHEYRCAYESKLCGRDKRAKNLEEKVCMPAWCRAIHRCKQTRKFNSSECFRCRWKKASKLLFSATISAFHWPFFRRFLVNRKRGC